MNDMMNYCPRLGQVNINAVTWQDVRLAVYVPPPRFDAAYWLNPHTPQVPQVMSIEAYEKRDGKWVLKGSETVSERVS